MKRSAESVAVRCNQNMLNVDAGFRDFCDSLAWVWIMYNMQPYAVTELDD